jgi:4-alpha-glucanotransferase
VAGVSRDKDRSLWSRRRGGVGMHFSSLPGPYGIGDIGSAARAFANFMHDCGLSVWQFLPIGPTAFGDSPDQPLSVFAGNPLLIDPEPLCYDGWLCEAELSLLRALPDDAVRYDQLIPLKLELLQRAAQRFQEGASANERDELAAYVASAGPVWLADYALFEILKRRHHGRPWHLWETPYAQRDRRSLHNLRRDAAQELNSIAITQFWFQRQWQALREHTGRLGILLFGDVPIYMAADCAEAWAGRSLLQLDANGSPEAVAGVPPDYFSDEGQWWGNPLYRWEAHAADGFAWWVARMRQAIAQFDVVRLDHFRGFESYWSIPAGARSAREGRWLQGPGAALFDALETALGPLPVVAEDLGIITPEVETLRDRYGFPGMQVLQFLLEDPTFLLEQIPANSVCYTGTHDNDTAVGWLTNAPVGAADAQRRTLEIMSRIGCSDEDLATALIELACRSRAQWIIAPMQDFLGLDSTARMNTPGRAENNWRWRMGPAQTTADLSASICSTLVQFGRT